MSRDQLQGYRMDLTVLDSRRHSWGWRHRIDDLCNTPLLRSSGGSCRPIPWNCFQVKWGIIELCMIVRCSVFVDSPRLVCVLVYGGLSVCMEATDATDRQASTGDLRRYRLNAGTASATLAQHWTGTGVNPHMAGTAWTRQVHVDG